MWLRKFARFIHAYQGSRARTWTQDRVPPSMSTSLFLVMDCDMYQRVSQSEHAQESVKGMPKQYEGLREDKLGV